MINLGKYVWFLEGSLGKGVLHQIFSSRAISLAIAPVLERSCKDFSRINNHVKLHPLGFNGRLSWLGKPHETH